MRYRAGVIIQWESSVSPASTTRFHHCRHTSIVSLVKYIFYIYITDVVCVFQNLNKQAYDLAKALLKRTAQAIEPYITNVSLAIDFRRIKSKF